MTRRPRVVVDTNVLVSAFLWQGRPGKLLERAGERALRLFTSATLLEELAGTLRKRKLARAVAATGLTIDVMVSNYRRLAMTVSARQLSRRLSRDPDDDAVLACAVAAHADLVISGDADLLVLKQVESIRIMGVAGALSLIPEKRQL